MANKKRSTKRKSNKAKKTSKRKTAIILLAVFVLGVVAGIVASSFLRGHRQQYEFTGSIANGIDVSAHNGDINWNEVANNVDFAFIRCGFRGYSNGKIEIDKKAKRNLKGANDSNVPVGLYFYSQALTEQEAEEEADFAIKLAKRYDISLPIAIDYEYAYEKDGSLGGRLYNANLSRKQSTAVVNAFCNRVDNAGYTPCVYASSYFYKLIIDANSINKNSYIWVADYNENVTYKGKYDIWQYSKKGKCEGVNSKYVDLDYWYVKK